MLPEPTGFVVRADLLNRPLRTRTVGGVGGNAIKLSLSLAEDLA